MEVDKNKLYNCTPRIQAKGFTELMLCVLHNDLESASKLLSEKDFKSEDINDKNSMSWTALHIACRNSAGFSSEEMVTFLLEKGANPNVKDDTSCTPLHYASEYSNSESSLETIKILIRNGANPNAKDKSKCTPLHVASFYSEDTSSLATVEALLKNGADPNAKELFYWWTPLEAASRNSKDTISLKTVDLLLRNGATPIDKRTEILKLEIDIKSLIEENGKLQQRIEILESEED